MIEQDKVKANFLRDISAHTMTVIHDDGLHRHLKFSNNGSWNQWFEIITWPGALCISGDMGTYVFRRVKDMFTFFRDPDLRINPNYWAEKVEAQDKCDGIEEFDEDAARDCVEEHVKQSVEDAGMQGEAETEFREYVEEEVLSSLNDGEHAFYSAMFEFSYDYEDGRIVFSDFWEHDLNTYTIRYLWCCYAIVWAIQQYDAVAEKEAAA